MIITNSAETTGWPEALRSISSKNWSVRNWSRVTRLPDSACDPLRTTSRLPGSPVRALLASMPLANALSRMTTETTAATPATVNSVVRHRISTLRKLYFNGSAMGIGGLV